MTHTVKITGLAYGGKGVGRIDGKVVFVPFTAPGDLARVELTAGKKGYSEGRLLEVVEPSSARREPPCPLFGRCGGCSLQHMDYSEQVRLKEDILVQTILRIGKTGPFEVDAAIACPRPFNYRSRARFHVEGGAWGFFEAESHRVIDLDACPILEGHVNDSFRDIKQALGKAGLPIFEVEMGLSRADAKTVVSFRVEARADFDWERALAGVAGLKGFEVRLIKGRKGRGRRIFSNGELLLLDEAGGARTSISVFSQANQYQNTKLVETALRYSGVCSHALDLFCGAGNITLPLAAKASEVTGVEESREAVELAVANAKAGGVLNAKFISGDAGEWLASNIKTLERKSPDVVVLDPPRGGDPDVAGLLARVRPAGIVYVSCAPPTLARDISILTGRGYRLKRACLIDMFPQTYHIEGIARLDLE